MNQKYLQMAVLAGVGLLLGCGDPIGPEERITGVIGLEPVFSVEVQRDAILVTMASILPVRGCMAPAALEIAVDPSARRISVTPVHVFVGGVCLDVSFTAEQVETIRPGAGSWTVVGRGLVEFNNDRIIEVEREVLVLSGT